MPSESGAPSDPGAPTEHAARNRAMWDDYSDEYQAEHGDESGLSRRARLGNDADTRIRAARPRRRGRSRHPRIRLRRRAMVDRAGQLGARPVGLDLSERQLQHARRLMAEAGVEFPLVHASAEAVPLPDASFDVVFCDHGAMSFADPYRTVPEVARLLRPGGLFAFSHHSPIETICWPLDAEEVGEQLALDYFGMHVIDDGEEVSFNLPYGEWIRLFRANGFVVEDLIEPQPGPDAISSYRSAASLAWARRWPGETSGCCAGREPARDLQRQRSDNRMSLRRADIVASSLIPVAELLGYSYQVTQRHAELGPGAGARRR